MKVNRITPYFVWRTPEWAISKRGSQWLRWAFLITLLAILACAFLLYCYYLQLKENKSPWNNAAIQVVLSSIGALGAIGATLLWEGMWNYWKNFDQSPHVKKQLWFYGMIIGVIFGCCLYYFFVYRPNIKRLAT